MTQWQKVKEVPAFAPYVKGTAAASAGQAAPGSFVPPPAPGRRAHDIDFEVHGNEMQFVEVQLDPGEGAVAEAGSMMYMSQGIAMETIFGDGSRQRPAGVMDALLGAGKRLLTGESLFMTVFTNQGQGKQKVAFGAPYPGKIIPMDLRGLGGHLVCQKDSFLCAARGVSIGIAFQKKLGVGLFGGEGFIMQKLEGDGLCFVHAGGTIHHFDCPTCGKPTQHEMPGATRRFKDFLEAYAPGASLARRRDAMYSLRSGTLHGNQLMQLDQDRAFGWDPPWWNERELHDELWGLTRMAVRAWLRNPPTT
jgi:uncharacterized protein (AIM24 family)